MIVARISQRVVRAGSWSSEEARDEAVAVPPVGNATGHMRAMGRGMWAAPGARLATN